jgi:Fur family transcriptional regulator, peroxide stress response regulator
MKKNLLTFKQKKIRATPQRLAVYRVLSDQQRHFTVEEIYFRIKKSFPGMSLATVYTALEELIEKGLVSEVRIRPERSCFEAKIESHHHLLCKKCGRIMDVFVKPCPTMKAGEIDGHRVEELHGYFYGLCRDCRSNEKAGKKAEAGAMCSCSEASCSDRKGRK